MYCSNCSLLKSRGFFFQNHTKQEPERGDELKHQWVLVYTPASASMACPLSMSMRGLEGCCSLLLVELPLFLAVAAVAAVLVAAAGEMGAK